MCGKPYNLSKTNVCQWKYTDMKRIIGLICFGETSQRWSCLLAVVVDIFGNVFRKKFSHQLWSRVEEMSRCEGVMLCYLRGSAGCCFFIQLWTLLLIKEHLKIIWYNLSKILRWAKSASHSRIIILKTLTNPPRNRTKEGNRVLKNETGSSCKAEISCYTTEMYVTVLK